MSVVDIDNTVIRGIKYLHSNSLDSKYYLGLLLDEAIKTSNYKAINELSELLNRPTVPHEYPTICLPNYQPLMQSSSKKESKLCSNSELELDLLNEDLACIVCKSMDVAAKNQLLECCKCHALYHQECHSPPVSQEEIDISQWVCTTCQSVRDNSSDKSNSNSNSSSYYELSEIASNDVMNLHSPTMISASIEERNRKRRHSSSSNSSNNDE